MEAKETLLLSAYKLFINKGFYNTSMQDLVAESGLSKGAFYHYFTGKKDIYVQVVERYFLSFYRKVDWSAYRAEQLSITDVEQEIRNFYRNFIPQILAITPSGLSRYYIMYFEAYEIYPEFKTIVQAFYRALEDLMRTALNGQEDAEGITTAIIARYEGILFLLAIDPERDIETLFSAL